MRHHLEIVQRGSHAHYDRVSQWISSHVQRGERILWISDREVHHHEGLGGVDHPDLVIDTSTLSHLEMALLITELIARELTSIIILEGTPLNFDQHYVRLRWICARFNVKLILFID